uniref:Zinc finger family protein n=1 Tax=Rhizophora mucronata TaxID=61149 RepID=A0A2P2K9L5_RHIMU
MMNRPDSLEEDRSHSAPPQPPLSPLAAALLLSLSLSSVTNPSVPCSRVHAHRKEYFNEKPSNDQLTIGKQVKVRQERIPIYIYIYVCVCMYVSINSIFF